MGISHDFKDRIITNLEKENKELRKLVATQNEEIELLKKELTAYTEYSSTLKEMVEVLKIKESLGED